MTSNIIDTFNDSTILITGCTGFLGKLLTEKLLTSCPKIKNIVVIIRNNKNLSAEERAVKIFNGTVFDRLRKKNPDFTRNIKIFYGDLQLESLNLSSNDLDWIVNNTNFIFHCAATLKFDENIKKATEINVGGTEQLLKIATQMKNLKGFIHVSTAYSHCTRQNIGEKFYPTEMTAQELMTHVKINDQDPTALNCWPNTYTFTKAITENLVLNYSKTIPIGIFRPSIVGSSYKEPLPGYLENMNGPSGIVAGIVTGFLRAIPCKLNNMVDIVPADYTINALITSMWDTATRYQNTANEEPKIYNYVSSCESPLTWASFMCSIRPIYKLTPPLCAVWYGSTFTYTNVWLGEFLWLILHWIPGIIFDFMILLTGKNARFCKQYKKARKMMNVLRPFSTAEWNFKNNNIQKLWSSLSKKDQELFSFNMQNFNWDSYISTFYLGIRSNILHENKDNIPDAIKKHKRLYWLHKFFTLFMVYVLFKLMIVLFSIV
ncbi:fatty acyl-CoA reductase wat-like [Daktulosphaira vitifoliae]|uniref:fatty acyl-CoA reductase wat-like n=1 Tax=Daktulosphaira vitifoliae TaxID=58002 RepID=UPI0021AA273A|nr:fatty acyl-CoA reductase wat-like [Daktulosphaira vitifoliae]